MSHLGRAGWWSEVNGEPPTAHPKDKMAPCDSLIASGQNHIQTSYINAAAHSIQGGPLHSRKCNMLFIISSKIAPRGASRLKACTKNAGRQNASLAVNEGKWSCGTKQISQRTSAPRLTYSCLHPHSYIYTTGINKFLVILHKRDTAVSESKFQTIKATFIKSRPWPSD